MSFRSHKTHTVALISVSLALSQTSVYTARPQIQGQCIAQHACLWPSFWWYLFRLCTDDGQAELTWVAGYIPKKFIRHRQSRIGPSVILLIETGMLPLNHAATHSIKYKVEYIPVEVMRTIAGNDNNWNVWHKVVIQLEHAVHALHHATTWHQPHILDETATHCHPIH